MKAVRYCWQQVILHWLSAIIILWTLISGFYVALIQVPTEVAETVSYINVSISTLFVPFFCVRWYYRWTAKQPALSGDSDIGRQLAHVVHEMIYWVTALVLLTGVLMMNRPIDVFGWFELPQLLSDHGLLAGLKVLHVAVCAVLGLLVSLHVAAVIKHEINGRRLLKRMTLSK